MLAPGHLIQTHAPARREPEQEQARAPPPRQGQIIKGHEREPAAGVPGREAAAAGGMAEADAAAELAAEIAAARAEFDGLEITLPGIGTYSARDLLDDLDADDVIETVAETCAINPGAFNA